MKERLLRFDWAMKKMFEIKLIFCIGGVPFRIASTGCQKKEFINLKTVSDLFPEYYILKVNGFNDVAKNSLNEWIFFNCRFYSEPELTF